MDLDNRKIERLREFLAPQQQNIVIVSHTNPDGDAIGSSLAWCRVLEGEGHRVTCIVPNRFPSFLDWMDGIDKIRIFKEDTTGELAARVAEADIIFCLDFNIIGRLEALSDVIAANTRAPRILIDHHLSPPHDYALMFSHPESCSTAMLVYRIIEEYKGLGAIDTSMGESLYVGMMTDTGNFSFSHLTPELFRAVAVLVEKGINIPYINTSVYNSYSEGRVRLLGYAINRKMSMLEEGTVAYIALTEAELRRFDFQLGDSEGFVNYPLSIKGMKMSAMFLQTRKFIRVSLRSRGDVDVNVFARKYFGGGGHKNAAGGKSFVSMEETAEHFKAAVAEFFHGN